MAETSTGQTIRARREELGLSRDALGHAARVSVRTLVRLELENLLPNVRAFARIVRELGLRLDELLPEDEPNGAEVA